MIAGLWHTFQMVGQTAFRELRCPASGKLIEECPGCRGPRVEAFPPGGSLPHFPAVIAYGENQLRGMVQLLDLHQQMLEDVPEE